MSSFVGRRQFVTGVLACSCMTCALSATHGQSATDGSSERIRRYCADSPISRAEIDADLKNRVPLGQYSNTGLRAYIEREKELLTKFFHTNSSVFYAPRAATAYMDPDRNFIAFNEGMVSKYKDREFGLLNMSGILAHEEGHIFQAAWNLLRMLEDVRGYKVKYVELHADYLAGAYMTWREDYRPGAAPAELAALFFELGDFRGFDVHHGTPQERFRAFQQGYHDFNELKRAQASADVRSAAAMGLLFIRRTLYATKNVKTK
jgi:hypothetical protein